MTILLNPNERASGYGMQVEQPERLELGLASRKADGRLAPKPGRSVCTRTILKPAVRTIIRFPFFHVRQAILEKLNREQILGKWQVWRR